MKFYIVDKPMLLLVNFNLVSCGEENQCSSGSRDLMAGFINSSIQALNTFIELIPWCQTLAGAWRSNSECDTGGAQGDADWLGRQRSRQ